MARRPADITDGLFYAVRFACVFPSHLRSLRRYDEPKTLSYSISHFCPTGADGLHQDLYALNLPVISCLPTTDKVMRMATASVMLESGAARLPETAPWLDDLEVELLAFPHGRHDDQVDSISQFLNWFRNRQWYDNGPIAGPLQAK
jgi:hypothetical protein